MTFAVIYSSDQLAGCEQRAFVLKAVGIEHVVGQQGDLFVLLVPRGQIDSAIDHLQQYESESRPKPPPPPVKLHSNAQVGSAVFALLMIAVSYLAGIGAGGLDWFAAGSLSSSTILHHEWWRAITALTLHRDVGHLVGNLAFGIPYGFFAAQLLGSGRAWSSIVIAATLGNLLDSALMSSNQNSVGASTAVFAMLGLVAAYSWRSGVSGMTRWAHRWAPLIAAIALLGFTGAGGERTDVVAHLAGFIFGTVLGAVHAHAPMTWWNTRMVQAATGIAACVAVVAVWAIALTR
jgi:membrane associated rhomboid family serine protease